MMNRESIGKERWINSVRMRKLDVCAGFTRSFKKRRMEGKQASKKKLCLSSNCRIEKADTKNPIDEGRKT
jgi:hypothetical protein